MAADGQRHLAIEMLDNIVAVVNDAPFPISDFRISPSVHGEKMLASSWFPAIGFTYLKKKTKKTTPNWKIYLSIEVYLSWSWNPFQKVTNHY